MNFVFNKTIFGGEGITLLPLLSDLSESSGESLQESTGLVADVKTVLDGIANWIGELSAMTEKAEQDAKMRKKRRQRRH